MKTQIIKKIALLVGGSCCLFISSCAMSEGRAEGIGKTIGTVGGVAVGVTAARKNNASTGQTIAAGGVGGAVGSEIGGFFGRSSSTLKGVEKVKR